MPKKEEYEDVFNKLLGTDIKWSKLSIEELIEIAVLFKNPEILVSKLGLKEETEDDPLLAGFIQTWRRGKGPIATLLRTIETLAEKKKETPAKPD